MQDLNLANTPEVMPDSPDTPTLPDVVTTENRAVAFDFISHNKKDLVTAAYRVGLHLVKDKPNLVELTVAHPEFSEFQYKSWKAFASLCIKHEIDEDHLFEHGFSMSAIAKSLKVPGKEKDGDPNKKRCSLEEITDPVKLRAEARKRIEESAKQAGDAMKIKLKVKHQMEIEAKDKTIADLEAKIEELQTSKPSRPSNIRPSPYKA